MDPARREAPAGRRSGAVRECSCGGGRGGPRSLASGASADPDPDAARGARAATSVRARDVVLVAQVARPCTRTAPVVPVRFPHGDGPPGPRSWPRGRRQTFGRRFAYPTGRPVAGGRGEGAPLAHGRGWPTRTRVRTSIPVGAAGPFGFLGPAVYLIVVRPCLSPWFLFPRADSGRRVGPEVPGRVEEGAGRARRRRSPPAAGGVSFVAVEFIPGAEQRRPASWSGTGPWPARVAGNRRPALAPGGDSVAKAYERVAAGVRGAVPCSTTIGFAGALPHNSCYPAGAVASQFLLPKERRSRPPSEGPTTPLSVSCQPAPVLAAVKAHRYALPPLRGADGLDGTSAQARADSWPTGAQHHLDCRAACRSQPKTIGTIVLRQPGNIHI